MNAKPDVLAMAALLAALFSAPPAAAQSSGKPAYVSDDITVTLREKASNDAPPIAALKSGTRLTVLEVLGADSFAHVRTADGREGWMTARYLSDQPAAKDQLQQLQQKLQASLAENQSLQHDLQLAQEQLAKAKPALAMEADNEKLKLAMAERERVVTDMQTRFDLEAARRRTLITGASLAGGGVLAGLILPMLFSASRRRRHRDLV